MKSCDVGRQSSYTWGSTLFSLLFPEGVKFPQVFVAEYENDKILFEVEMDMDVDDISALSCIIPVLPGSAISGYDGMPVSPPRVGAVINTVLSNLVRVPDTEELDFYERHSNL